MTLEERVQELEDDRAIRELLARYGYNADQGRSEAYVNLFTEDGALDITTGPGGRGAGMEPRSVDREVINRFDGHKALRAFITDPKGHKSIEGNCLHVHGNNLTTHIDGDKAVADSYGITLVRQDAGFLLLTAAANRWTLRKTDGQWRIKECFRRRPGTEEFHKVHVTME
jgi:hypothetical protein